MTNNSPLDEHIKGRFSNYTPDVPPHIWENIIAEKEKRKPAGFWFSFLNKNLLFLLMGIVLTGTGIFIYKNVDLKKDATSNTINNPVNTVAEKANNNSVETNNYTSAGISTETKSNQPAGKENNISTENETIKSNNNIPGSTGLTSTEKNYNTPNTKNNVLISSADNKNDLPTPILSNNTTKGNSYKKQKNLKGTAALTYENPGTTSEDIAETISTDLLLQRQLLNLDMISAEKTFSLSIKKTNNPHLDIPCPEAEKNTAGNKKYFEIYAGPDYAFRSITDTGNSVYLKKRKESTSFSSAFSAGLRYTKVFGNGMSFRTGINYSQINEKFKFAQGNIIQLVYIIDNNGDTTGSYTTTNTRYKTTYNKFRTIDIPILVGYELGNGRIHANFNVGAIVNLYSWQKGDVLDTAYQPISITTGKTSSPYQFKTNVGIGFMGAISVYYKLTEKWHIFAEPYFRYNFSSASKTNLTLKQKYNTLGLRIGVRMDF